jgi:hypothetical protein
VWASTIIFPVQFSTFFRTDAIVALKQPWTPFAQNKWRHAYNFVGRQIVRFGGLANRESLTRFATLRTVTGFLEKVFGMVGPDTGYLLCNAADQHGLKRVMFEVVAAQHPAYPFRCAFEGFQVLADQWELFYHGEEPILTHKYGTQSWMWRTEAGHNVEYWREQIALFEEAVGDD